MFITVKTADMPSAINTELRIPSQCCDWTTAGEKSANKPSIVVTNFFSWFDTNLNFLILMFFLDIVAVSWIYFQTNMPFLFCFSIISLNGLINSGKRNWQKRLNYQVRLRPDPLVGRLHYKTSNHNGLYPTKIRKETLFYTMLRSFVLS